ncbi:phosphoribosylamine--glycine ligase [Pelagibacteraceae bacterium]|nr:phosphoribosylamine--glycine ligase [Pelagibacteraceae bacterium]
MNVAVIGSGGREHAICFQLQRSKEIKKLFCIPGNAGTKTICENIDIDYLNFHLLYSFLQENNVNTVIVGPEIPLVAGIVDFLSEKNIYAFGPSKKASQLEGSKAFMKKLCKDFNIPTAKYEEFDNFEKAKSFIEENQHPLVIKSDGLAAGKGVTISSSIEESLKCAKEILDGKFKSSKKFIIEEFLEGEEASYFIITDGDHYIPIGTAQDHKRIGEGDTGPNTGGMGAYSPSLIIDENIEKKIQTKIIEPTLKGLNKIGCKFTGILYAGLMISNGEPKLIEYNIRFGDPECQVLMMRLKTDLLTLVNAVKKNKIHEMNVVWNEKPCITVVAAAKGYPDKYNTLTEIKNIEKIKTNDHEQLFHAGTILKDNKILANGGRVLSATCLGKTLEEAKNKANAMLDAIDWQDMYYRKDIGWRAFKKN